MLQPCIYSGYCCSGFCCSACHSRAARLCDQTLRLFATDVSAVLPVAQDDLVTGPQCSVSQQAPTLQHSSFVSLESCSAVFGGTRRRRLGFSPCKQLRTDVFVVFEGRGAAGGGPATAACAPSASRERLEGRPWRKDRGPRSSCGRPEASACTILPSTCSDSTRHNNSYE